MSGRLAVSPLIEDRIRASGCDYIVTGAGGWLGRGLIDILDHVLGDETLERVRVFASCDRDIRLPSGRVLRCKRLAPTVRARSKPTIVLHCAFLTRDKLAHQSVDDFVGKNTAISDKMDAILHAHDVRGFFMPSSGAVYKPGTKELSDSIAANPYGVLKIRDERRFCDWARRAGVPACLPRVFNLSGPYINKPEHYALASIILAFLKGDVIRIRADRTVKRSFVHLANLLELALAMLLDPQPGDTPIFDTAGEEVLEMQELAVLVCSVLGDPNRPIERPDMRCGDEDVYVGDGTAFERMLRARRALRLLINRQIVDTTAFLRGELLLGEMSTAR